MNELGVIIVSGLGHLPPLLMTSKGMRCLMLMVDLPDPAPLPNLETVLKFTRMPEIKLDAFIPRQTAWERRNCNAPWWRRVNHKRNR